MHIRKHALFWMALLILLFDRAPELHAQRTVRMGIYHNPPLSSLDAQGKPGGIYVDILDAIALEEDWQIEYVACEWADCLEQVRTGEIDLLGPIAYSEERDEWLDFNRETVITNWGQVYARRSDPIQSLLEIDGKRVGVLKDDIHYDAFSVLVREFDIDCEFVEASSYDDVMLLLDRGEVDAGVTNRLYGMINQHRYSVTRSPIIFNPLEIRFAAPSGTHTDLLDALDRHLIEMKDDPDSAYHAAFDRWLSSLEHTSIPTWLRSVLWGTTGLLFLLAFGSIFLRLQVNRRTKELREEITERKRVLNALQVSEEKYRDIFERSRDVVYITSWDGKIINMNQAGYALFGCTADEAKNINVRGLYADREDRLRFQAAIAEQGAVQDYEVTLKKLDGTLMNCLLTTAVRRDKEGHIIGYQGVIRDVTELKRAQAAERDQRLLAEALSAIAAILNSTLDQDEVFRLILDTVGQVVPHDAADIMLIENDQMQIAWHRGYEKYQVTGEQLTQARFETRTMNTFRAMMETGEPCVIPEVRADRSWVRVSLVDWVQSYVGVPIRVDGTVLGFINLNSSTPGFYDARHAERLQLFADQAAVAIRNARLYGDSREYIRQLLLRSQITRVSTATYDLDDLLKLLVGQAVKAIDADTCTIALWNPDKEHPIPTATSIHRYGTPTRGLLPGLEKLALAKTVMENGITIVEDVLKLPSISPEMARDFSCRSYLGLPLKAHGVDTGVLIYGFHDSHTFPGAELEQAEQLAELVALAIAKAQSYENLERRVAARTVELRDAHDRLQELYRLKDEFVSNVSHELRTPIASLKLYHHLLRLREDKAEVYLDRIGREISRLEYIIEDLLMLSRLDQNRLAGDVGPVDLNEVATLYIVDRLPLAETLGLVLSFDGHPNLSPVWGDYKLLEQALGTILTNALNYTPRGGNVQVSTLERTEDGRLWVGLSVIDSGPGIGPDERDHIFERFFRGQVGYKSGKPGTGLGLAIANEIITRYGGEIEIISPVENEHGSKFTIWLPTVKSSETAADQDDSS